MSSSSNSNSSSNNINLFATGGKVVKLPSDGVNESKNDETVISKSMMELQAEYLRLEAEKEETLMRKSRIDEEKVSFIFILRYLLNLTSNLFELAPIGNHRHPPVKGVGYACHGYS